MRSQLVDVGRPQRFLLVGELFRKETQSLVDRRERRGPPVTRNSVNEGVSFDIGLEQSLDLFTEIMRVRLSSVKAVVRLRGDHRKHFTLTSTQGRRPEHDGSVKLHRSVHRPRTDAHDVHDVPHAPRAFDRPVEQLSQKASGFVNGYLSDVGHDEKSRGEETPAPPPRSSTVASFYLT
jgi:hypothetical protein